VATPEVAKMVSHAWKNLSPNSKQKYDDIALKDKQRYEAEKAAYEGPWKVQVKTLADLRKAGAPKQPITAFLSYMNDVRPLVGHQYTDVCGDDLTRTIAARWKAEPDHVRQRYLDEATEKRREYKESMTKWLLENGLTLDESTWKEIDTMDKSQSPDIGSDETDSAQNRRRRKHLDREASTGTTADSTSSSKAISEEIDSSINAKAKLRSGNDNHDRKQSPTNAKKSKRQQESSAHLMRSRNKQVTNDRFILARQAASAGDAGSYQRDIGESILQASLRECKIPRFQSQPSGNDHRSHHSDAMSYSIDFPRVHNNSFANQFSNDNEDDLSSLGSLDLPFMNDTTPIGDNFQWL
jgi:hypothetical protein